MLLVVVRLRRLGGVEPVPGLGYQSPAGGRLSVVAALGMGGWVVKTKKMRREKVNKTGLKRTLPAVERIKKEETKRAHTPLALKRL